MFYQIYVFDKEIKICIFRLNIINNNLIQDSKYQYGKQKGVIKIKKIMQHNNKIDKCISEVMYEENYIYKENALTHIEIKQYDINGKSSSDLVHIFQYQDDGDLESITKSFPNGYSEIIYKTKKGC